MSVMIRSQNTDVLDNVIIFYDFTQIHDAIMIVTFDEKSKSWERVFVYYAANGWETNSLKQHVNDKKFKWVSKKLNLIFQQSKVDVRFDNINLNDVMKNESKFVLALNQAE